MTYKNVSYIFILIKNDILIVLSKTNFYHKIYLPLNCCSLFLPKIYSKKIKIINIIINIKDPSLGLESKNSTIYSLLISEIQFNTLSILYLLYIIIIFELTTISVVNSTNNETKKHYFITVLIYILLKINYLFKIILKIQNHDQGINDLINI